MNINKALKVISEAMVSGEIDDLNKKIVRPLKKAYGVEELIFWTDDSNWFYCDFTMPKFEIFNRSNYTIDKFKDLEMRLKSLQENNGMVIFRGKQIRSLNELKEEILIRKLSGILE